MEEFKKTRNLLWGVIFIAALAIIGLIGTIFDLNKEVDKYNTLMNMACHYGSTNTTKCKAGLDMLKSMNLEDIKKWGF